MADLMIRRQNPNTQQASTSRDSEPYRMVRDLLGFDPFQEMAPRWAGTGAIATFSPAFEIKESKGAYLFRADVPGIKEENIDVTLVANRLTVSGKREEETEERGDTYYTCETSYGTFSRSFNLPEGADFEHVHADLKGGVLSIAIPKKPEVQPKRVTVTSSEKTPKV